MNPFEKLADFLGLREAAAAPPPATPATPSATTLPAVPAPTAARTRPAAPVPMPPPAVVTQYQPILDALHAHLRAFMNEVVDPHRSLEPDDLYCFSAIQVIALDTQGAELVDRFFQEFKPPSLIRFADKAIRECCTAGVSTHGPLQLQASAPPAGGDDDDQWNAQLQTPPGSGPEIRIALFGRWELQASPSLPPVTAHGPRVELHIHDAQGQRQLSDQPLPLHLGRAQGPGVVQVQGQFVSRRHGRIEADALGDLWYVDTSINGSWLQGRAVRPGERVPLSSGVPLQLGGHQASLAACPELRVTWPQGAPADGATPLRAPLTPAGGDGATPLVAPANTPLAASAAGPVCLLAVQDALGSRTLPVLSLPFRIGRDPACDYVVPEAHAGVSRIHLELLQAGPKGLSLRHQALPSSGRWGTSLQGVEQPEHFELAWGQSLSLAPRYTQASPVSLTLLPPPTR